MGYKKRFQKKSADRGELIEKSKAYLASTQEALALLSNQQLLSVLQHNGKSSTTEDNIESEKSQLVIEIAEYMAFGIVGSCPKCGSLLKITKQGYHCEKNEEKTEEETEKVMEEKQTDQKEDKQTEEKKHETEKEETDKDLEKEENDKSSGDKRSKRSGGKRGDGKCRFRSFSPPQTEFLVPEDMKELAPFTGYSFTKMYRDFQGNNSLQDRWTPVEGGSRGNKKDGYVAAVTTSKKFEEYYRNQAGVIPEGEFETFLHTLRQPLPSTFRVTGFGRNGRELQKAIQNDYLNDVIGNFKLKVDDVEVDPPHFLSWYPDNLAWQLNMDRRSIRHIPELAKLKHFLINETNSGNISRQEAVSMIPPLVLDVKPHHRVLDMCAAPGSKTSQIIELLHADESKVPEGVVVANDSNQNRCYLMCHQVKRLATPCFMVINHDASQLPGFRLEGELVMFDRVLADVPCSGDGTLRKNVDAWQKWSPTTAHYLHTLQARILKRGLQMLRTGGRLVYSTCSLNPIENEAVLSHVLSQYEGKVELVDVSACLPGLKYLPGMKTWRVLSKAGEWYTQFANVPERLEGGIPESLFPPTQEVADNLHLERCMRVLPHLQNTGGFFIAVLHKSEDGREKKKQLRQQKRDAAATEANGEDKPEDTEEDSNKRRKREKEAPDYDNPLPLKRQKLSGYKEDPFVFLEIDDPIMDAVKLFYGLSEDFPVDQVLVRCEKGKKRNMYFVTKTVKDLARTNDDKVKFINMGVKILNRSESKYCKQCDYRLVQEGIEMFYPYITRRIVRISNQDVIKLLTMENPFINQFTKLVQDQLCALDGEGSLVFVFDPECMDFEKVEKPACKIIITGWKGVVSARTFLPVSERAHFLRLCGMELKSKEEQNIERSKEEAVGDCEGSEDSGDLVGAEGEKLDSANSDMDSEKDCDSEKESAQVEPTEKKPQNPDNLFFIDKTQN